MSDSVRDAQAGGVHDAAGQGRGRRLHVLGPDAHPHHDSADGAADDDLWSRPCAPPLPRRCLSRSDPVAGPHALAGSAGRLQEEPARAAAEPPAAPAPPAAGRAGQARRTDPAGQAPRSPARRAPRPPSPPATRSAPRPPPTCEEYIKDIKGKGPLKAMFETTQGKLTCELFDEEGADDGGQLRGPGPRPEAVQGPQDQRDGEAAVLRRPDLPPGHPRLHDPGRRSAGRGHRRSRLPLRRRVRPHAAPRQARPPVDGQRRPRAPTAASSSSPSGPPPTWTTATRVFGACKEVDADQEDHPGRKGPRRPQRQPPQDPDHHQEADDPT